jgi:hypothetical protein
MTPKEKAIELVGKLFDSIFPSYDANELAKQCALIAVDEILEIVASDDSAIIVELQFWQEVKQEIEKL